MCRKPNCGSKATRMDNSGERLSAAMTRARWNRFSQAATIYGPWPIHRLGGWSFASPSEETISAAIGLVHSGKTEVCTERSRSSPSRDARGRRARQQADLFQPFRLNRNILLALGALLPILLDPGLVTFSGGRIASGKSQSFNFGVRDLRTLVARGQHQAHHRVGQSLAHSPVEQISRDLRAVLARDGYIAAIVEGDFSHRADVSFGSEFRNPPLQVFALKSRDDFQFIRGIGWRNRSCCMVREQRFSSSFAAAHARLSSATATSDDEPSICTKGL